MIRIQLIRFYAFFKLITCIKAIGILFYLFSFFLPSIVTKANVCHIATNDTSIVICGNFLDISTTGIVPKFTSGIWKKIDGSGTILNENTFYAFFSNLIQQKNTFLWTSSNKEEQITLTVYNHQSKAVIFKDAAIERSKTFCTTKLNLVAQNPEKNLVGAKGWWLATVEPPENIEKVNFFNQSQVVSSNKDSITTLAYNINAAGTYTLKWIVKHPDCKADTAEWTIINKRNIAKIINKDTINKPTCGLPMTVVVQKPTTNSNGEWRVKKLPSTATPAPLETLISQTNTTQNWTISNFTKPGSYDLLWIVNSKIAQECPADSQTVSILNVKPLAELDYNNPLIDVCGSTVLKARNPSVDGAGLTGKWILDKKPANAAPINTENLKYNSTVNFNKPGSYYFKWVVQKDKPVCNSDTVSIIFNNIKPSIVNAGKDSTVCSSIYDLKGTDKNLESLPNSRGLWSIYSKPAQTEKITFDDSTRANAIVRNLKKIGSYGFIWTVFTSSANIPVCTNSDSILITNNLHADFEISTIKDFCDTLKLLPPNKEFPSGKITPVETWRVSENNNPNNSIMIFFLADNITRATGFPKPGNYKFDYTFSYSGCERKTVITSNNLKPSPFVIDNKGKNFCSDSIQLSAPTVEAGFRGEWKNVNIAGMPTPKFTNSSLTNTYVNGFDKPGIYQFQWVVSNPGTLQCSRASEPITYTNEKASPLPSIYKTDVNFCNNVLKLVNPAKDAGFTYNNSSWSLVPTENTTIKKSIKGDTTIFSNFADSNNMLIVWSMANTTNPSCQRFDTIRRINQQPNVVNSAGSDMEVCGKDNIVTMDGKINTNMPLIKGKWTLIEKPKGARNPNFIGDSTDSNLRLSGFNRSGVYRLGWTLNNLGCIETDEVILTNKAPDTIYAKSLLRYNCGIFDSLIGNTVKGQPTMKDATYSWRFLVQPIPKDPNTTIAVIADTTLSSTKINNMVTEGDYTLLYSIQNNTCIVTDTVTISRSKKFPATVPKSNYYTCEDSLIIYADPSKVLGSWNIAGGSQLFPVPLNDSKTKVMVKGFSEAEVNEYIWVVEPTGCRASTASVFVKKYPKLKKIAFAKPIINICEYDTITLKPAPRTDLTMTANWFEKDTTKIISFKDNYKADSLPYGKSVFKFRWVEPNGACQSNIDSVIVRRDSAFQKNINLSYKKILCEDSIKVASTVIPNATYKWTASSSNPSVINPSNYDRPTISWFKGFVNSGFYNIFLTISRGACVHHDTIVTERKNSPSIAMITTPKIFKDTICEQEEAKIFTADSLKSGTKGYWIVNKEIYANDTTTIKVRLEKGKLNTIVWTTSTNQYCVSQDQRSVFVSIKPAIAFAGNDKKVYSPSSKLDATTPQLNTGDRAQWLVPNNNTANIENINSPKTEVTNLALGQNIFYWKIYNNGCVAELDTVVITRLQSEIPKAFSPNNDEKNQTFFITGIEEYESSSLEVFNRWGDLVYANNDYKNDWAGLSKDGKPLPDDTYYYVLNLGKNNTIKNFVIIKR